MPNLVSTTASLSMVALRLFVISLLFWVFLLPIQAHSEPASKQNKTEQVEWITRAEAKSMMRKEIFSHPEYKLDSKENEYIECTINATLEDVFGNKSQLTSQDYTSRLSTFMKNTKNDDSRLHVVTGRCVSAHLESASKPKEIDREKWITKAQAKTWVHEEIISKHEFNSDPLKREVVECVFVSMIDDIFGSKNQLITHDFEKKLKLLMDNSGKDDLRMKMISLRCVANSKEVEKRLTLNAQDQRSRPKVTPIPLLDLDDFRLDASELDGKQVRVRGIGRYVMDTFMLRKSTTDMSPVLIDIKGLPRETRKEILLFCSDVMEDEMESCRLTIYGTVKARQGMKSIIAEQIFW